MNEPATPAPARAVLDVENLRVRYRRGSEELVDGRAATRRPAPDRSRLRVRRLGFVFQDSELDPEAVAHADEVLRL